MNLIPDGAQIHLAASRAVFAQLAEGIFHSAVECSRRGAVFTRTTLERSEVFEEANSVLQLDCSARSFRVRAATKTSGRTSIRVARRENRAARRERQAREEKCHFAPASGGRSSYLEGISAAPTERRLQIGEQFPATTTEASERLPTAPLLESGRQ